MTDPIAVAHTIVVASLGGVGVPWLLARALPATRVRPPAGGGADVPELRRAVERSAGRVVDRHERMDSAGRVLASREQAPHLTGEN